MWKAGVVARGPKLDRALAFPGSRRLAFTLLEELEHSYTPADEPLLDRLYNQVVVGGHVYKTTRRGRFADLDRELFPLLDQCFPAGGILRIHDVGASNAITSLDLFRFLSSRRPVSVRASDLYDSLSVVTPEGCRWQVVFDPDESPLQYVGRRFVLSASEGESRRHPVNRWLARRLLLRVLPKAQRLLASATPHGVRTTTSGGGRVRRISLLHPECHRALREHPEFTFERHDLFQATAPYDIVRALNVLNPGYFSHEDMTRAVKALGCSVRRGGLLVLGRTVDEGDGQTRATVFLREGSRWNPIWERLGGAENAAAVAATGLTPAAP